MLTEVEKKIIHCIQDDIPLAEAPFAHIAEQAGISEEECISIIREMKKQGIIRRFGATLRHQQAGYNFNVMVVWNIPEDKIDETGAIFAGFRNVSHCYYRPPKGDWPYNIYTMIHGRGLEENEQLAEEMSEASGIKDYILLPSIKELKKTSMSYF